MDWLINCWSGTPIRSEVTGMLVVPACSTKTFDPIPLALSGPSSWNILLQVDWFCCSRISLAGFNQCFIQTPWLWGNFKFRGSGTIDSAWTQHCCLLSFGGEFKFFFFGGGEISPLSRLDETLGFNEDLNYIPSRMPVRQQSWNRIRISFYILSWLVIFLLWLLSICSYWGDHRRDISRKNNNICDNIVII